jgi:hypothetical protein
MVGATYKLFTLFIRFYYYAPGPFTKHDKDKISGERSKCQLFLAGTAKRNLGLDL